MIRLPDQPLLQSTTLGLTKSSNEGQLASMESALLEGESITSLGRAVSDVSDVFVQHLTRIQGIEDNRKVLEGKSQLASQFADHNIQLQSDFDPTSRLVKTKAFFEQYEKNMDLTDTSPIVQAKLKDYLLDVRTQGNINQAQDSLMLSTKRSQAATLNRLDLAKREGNLSEIESALNDDPTILPEEKARLRAVYSDAISDDQEKADISRNPKKWKEENPEPRDGESESRWVDYDELADRVIVRDNNKFLNDAYTEIARDEKSPDQVERDYDLLPADDIEKLKNYARQLENGVLLDKQNDPVFQAEAVKNVQEMLKQFQSLSLPYDPVNPILPSIKGASPAQRREAIDKTQSNIINLINLMPEGSYKIYLKSELDSIVYNTARRNKSNAEVVIRESKAMAEQGEFGGIAAPEMMNTSDALEADFLVDRAKLAKIGFDLKDDDVTDELDLMDKAKTIEEKKTIFRRIYSKYVISANRLPQSADGVPSLEVATAQAIETGANVINYISPASQTAYLKAQSQSADREGRYTIAMFEFQDQNPGCSVQDLRDERKRLMQIDARNDAKRE